MSDAERGPTRRCNEPPPFWASDGSGNLSATVAADRAFPGGRSLSLIVRPLHLFFRVDDFDMALKRASSLVGRSKKSLT